MYPYAQEVFPEVFPVGVYAFSVNGAFYQPGPISRHIALLISIASPPQGVVPGWYNVAPSGLGSSALQAAIQPDHLP
jgi:hypothetical protein